jgi:putative Holliday junction resolvase
MRTRILGLDIGDRWTGVALSDPGGVLATPLLIIDRELVTDDVGAVVGLVRKYEVTRVVVGLPRAADGTIGRQAAKVQGFVDRLSRGISIPIDFRDERLSTVSATSLLRASGRKRSGRKVRDDAAAAAIILQGYLDERRPQSQDRANTAGS